MGTSLIYGGNLTLSFSSTYGAGTYSWNLFDFGSQSGSFDNVLLTGAYSGSLSNILGNWSLSSGTENWTFTQSDGILTLTVIPEPATWALIALGTGLAALGRRKRRG